ncbi:YigZ family protein [Pseudactinotalea sp. HY158]|uniref:IMPACT family protein n=1 Tax=Pseudactinotalea sp. HY158 TaxID=2654547 RepID=UPI00129C3D9A|nr:YigZ family protein [Pseudactinotalea sp. HY158]QGH68235.1 DUF1949 domain-containing protein [Pseudactinotalea sp. HY158]
MSRQYSTISGEASAEIEVKRSRFRCDLTRVATEEAAREAIARARAEFWDARHHCSAFVLGPAGDPDSMERSSDDGEPAGTAGAPMLEVLRGAELRDVVAVVTRWFGGTLLGAGGLVRAYSDSVRAAVEVAPIQRRELVTEVEVTLGEDGYVRAGRLEADLRARGIAVLDVAYAERVTFLLGTPGEPGELAAQIAGLTAGTANTRVRRTTWVDR